MVRFLLHSENATYNATTKKYTFALDRRIANPRSIRLSKANYQQKTETAYPLSVYVRSDAVTQLIKKNTRSSCPV